MTYAEIFNKIVNARKLETLRKAVDFYESVVLDVKGEEDVFIGVLEDMLAEKKDSPIHQMLLDYIKETNDEDELIDALFEFNLAIDLFKTVRKEVVFQIKADDFNLALNKAEEIFELKSILESRYKIEVIETKAMPFVDYESVVTRKNKMYILLPMVRHENDKDELLERILSFCMHKFCSEQFDFQTVSSITEHFMPRENQFEMQLRQFFKEKTLAELLDAIDDFCRNSFIRENDDEIMNLKEQVDEITDNDYIVMLSAYMCAAEDGDEVIEALYEFVSNCKGFVEPDEDLTQQVTKEEFEEVLNECEDKCAIMSCIEENHTINVAEVPMYNRYREFGLRIKNNAINLFLPKIDINTDTKKFIGEELGIILYKVLSEEFTPDYIRREMNRYISETRNREEPIKELFKEYFYQVVLYKERKPGIYMEIDDHMRRIFILEFFKRIIREYKEKQGGKSSAKSSRVFT